MTDPRPTERCPICGGDDPEYRLDETKRVCSNPWHDIPATTAQRKQFEKWAGSRPDLVGGYPQPFLRRKDGRYLHWPIYILWEGWQARGEQLAARIAQLESGCNKCVCGAGATALAAQSEAGREP